ncbi:hypothetical protein AVEN_23602-1 [Araneus ventricosus]|uniref:Uncharacterized protein n=1 Tax=Araneus ventricosus TaxID=182803 RepID=A0A4Y2BH03_ARAVE|nr:hypothetical protein AVEN_23602-1 [Araneus ventricosus]
MKIAVISIPGPLRSWLWGRRVSGSRLNAIEESPCKGVLFTLNLSGPNVLPMYGTEARRGDCQLRRRSCDLTTVQNYKVRPEIALVLLQNET